MNMSLKSEEGEEIVGLLRMTDVEIAAAKITNLDIKVDTAPDRIILIADYLSAPIGKAIGWCLLQVTVGREDELIETLETIGFTVWRPQFFFKNRIRKTKRYRIEKEDALPGYLFVAIDDAPAFVLFGALKHVHKIVSNATGPVIIGKNQIKRWMDDLNFAEQTEAERRAQQAESNWKKIKINQGPFSGFIATVNTFLAGRDVFICELDALGKTIKCEIPLDCAKKYE